MSWSAAVPGGAPPYAQAPYQQPYAQRPPYQPSPYGQPYQQGYGSGPPRQPPSTRSGSSAYPPKRKGNPVITRYAPPAGYQPQQPPPNGPPGYGQPGYPAQGYQVPQSYPPQGFQPPAYPQQQPWQPQNWQQTSPQGYAPQGYSQPPQGWQAPTQTYGPQAYPPPAQPAQPAPGPMDSSSAQWQQPQPHSYPPYGVVPQDPGLTPTPSHASPAQGPRPPKRKNRQESRNASVTASEPPESHRLYQTDAYAIDLGMDDWDQADFEGAIWPKANDPIDTDLSLGIINWHPANQVTRALPSSFEAAEEIGAHPPPPKIGNRDSVSEYFTCENSHEAFLNVRQTADWDHVKSDCIFYEFSDNDKNVINLEEVVAFRDRPDLPLDDPEPQEEALDPGVDRDGDWNVMDNLEQALASSEHASIGHKTMSPRDSATGSRPPPNRDQAQEDLLAALGVTGSPKPIKPMSVPTSENAEHTSPTGFVDHAEIFDQTSNSPRPRYSNGFRSNPPPRPPPPPEPIRSPSPDPWSMNGVERKPSPARSDRSQHTAAGSDFHVDDNDPFSVNAAEPPNPRLLRSESSAGRKRSYDESENQGDAKHRQEDDYTPRMKRKQPRVAAAYA
ncbi:hypothetical protein K490DRAFT_69963 [Saccharata proteae CBS 121410]|uniref:Uncharacterized protein n=1 Tax=Saccharata proteae CBS 121410 TaxID=1314787 RepID=A0A9P4HM12_9PEZI|nr:hypothetical protein K490DRAFT_69963 [Saccharata proteae CBS 121410]